MHRNPSVESIPSADKLVDEKKYTKSTQKNIAPAYDVRNYVMAGCHENNFISYVSWRFSSVNSILSIAIKSLSQTKY